MDFKYYLDKFQRAANKIDKQLLNNKKVEVAVGIYLDSVFLKLYKKSWSTQFQDPLTAESRIFFSVWINDSTIKEHKMLYNIHALKLRQLKGYSIESRKFADTFRASFMGLNHKWPNASVQFGPLTLVQGWVKIDLEDFCDDILTLANNFLEIEYLIDNTLTNFKQQKRAE